MDKKNIQKRKFYQKKRVIIPIVVGLALIFLGIFGALFSSYISSIYQSSTSAKVDDYIIEIYPKISGKISQINTENKTYVKKGEIIAQIDTVSFEKLVEDLNKKTQEANEKLKLSQKELDEFTLKLNKTKEDIKSAKMLLETANEDYIRYKIAFKDKLVTKKDLEKAISNLETAQEQYSYAQEAFKKTNEEYVEIAKQKTQNDIAFQQILSELDQMKLNLSYTTFVAPKSGLISFDANLINKELNESEAVFTILSDKCDLIANFKKLPNVKYYKGQKAIVKINSLKGHKFQAEVIEIIKDEENNISLKIQISQDMKKYNIKNNDKASVKIKIK